MFTGRQYDPETGLYYYRARYYNATIGRFLQTDPIGYAGGLNLYTYCGNDPVNWVDPYGLCKKGLDRLQMALDAGGTFEPTPFCDLINAIISACRGEFFDAGCSLAGVVPYFGDPAKLAKYANKLKKADKAVDVAKAEAKAAKKGGETAATARGREAHKNYPNALGDGYETEVTLSNGKRADAVNVDEQVVRELKPDNAKAITKGEKQAQDYAETLEEMYGIPFTPVVDTYKGSK